VRHKAARGQIPAFKTGRRAWSFYTTDIDAYIESLERRSA
jgi:hypothetical protein